MPPLSADEIPQGCRLALVSPYDVRFSQYRIRAEFQDGRTIEETQAQTEAVPYSERTASSTTEDVPAGGPDAQAPGAANEIEDVACLGDIEDLSADRGKEFLLLKAPFPQIEVTRWRCKLREADGSPKIDADSGLELYACEERWFAFDNRRLCCAQRVAAELWPREVRMYVIVIPPALARSRELRKFDTKTAGSSVLIGRRNSMDDAEKWCWRTRVGLPAEDIQEEGVAKEKSSRFRRQSGSGRFHGDHDNGRHDNGRPTPPNSRGRRRPLHMEESEQGADVVRSAMLFLVVYLALRLAVSVFRTAQGAQAPSGASGGPLHALLGRLIGALSGSSPALGEALGPPATASVAA